MMTSPDGVNWTRRFSGSSEVLQKVFWTGRSFMVVGFYGTILESGNFSPRIRDFSFQPDGFRLQFDTDAARTYQVQCSSDLINWTTLEDVVAEPDGSPTTFIDRTATAGERRFYRTLLVP
jgi:hypothetical protein